MEIQFNKSIYLPEALKYVEKAIKTSEIAGDGEFTKKSSKMMEEKFDAKKILMTTSCTAALEMSAILLDIKPGDEIIMPSYTFVSTANAFVMQGGVPVFVDIRPDTMNIDESLIETAITPKTKAIVAVHYAGVGCEMDKILDIARRYNLPVVEDAAQGVMAQYKGKYLGTIGTFGCYSFHETKNYTMGEGGALVINDEKYIERAEILREKGTNRSKFYRGQVDKYTWVDKGSSYLPSEINVAYLYGQLLVADEINENRLSTWDYFYNEFCDFPEEYGIELPVIPEECKHNAHMFYLKFKDLAMRSQFIDFMLKEKITCPFHYVPLHSSQAGKRFARFNGEDKYTTSESERLARLPMYYGLTEKEKTEISQLVKEFVKGI